MSTVELAIAHAAATMAPSGYLLSAKPLEGGVSAAVYRLDIADPELGIRRVVFRQHRKIVDQAECRRVTKAEHQVHHVLCGLGFAVPQPCWHHDQPDGPGVGPYLAMEWAEGSTKIPGAALPNAISQMAQFLVALHELDVESLGDALSAVRPLEDPAVAIGPFLDDSDAARRLAAYLRAQGSGLFRRDDVQRRALVHGDFWPGNLLWHHDELVAVLDWEDASIGDPLADLATARCEVGYAYGPEARETLTASYCAQRGIALDGAVGKSLDLWDAYVSASALHSIAGWGLAPEAEAHRRQATSVFFGQAVARLTS